MVYIHTVLIDGHVADDAPVGTIVRIKKKDGTIGCAVREESETGNWSVNNCDNVSSEELIRRGSIVVVWVPKD